MATKPGKKLDDDDDDELIFTKKNASRWLGRFAGPAFEFVLDVLPVIISICQKAHKVYAKIPMIYVQLIFGMVLCFFGGFYPTVFAALQAAEFGGLETVAEALSILSKEVMIIVYENEKDNEVDADGDGVPDASTLEGRDFVKRKMKLVLAKINPEKVNTAIASIYKVWMSVLAVLTVEFARTITLSLTITKVIKRFADRLLLPVIDTAIPDEYQKWGPIVVAWWCQGIGISIAWKIQTVISALASAVAGGLLVSRAVIMLRSKGTKNLEETYMDEFVGYILAFLGFQFQYNQNFTVPFPFNIILFPVQIAETYIRWAVTNAAA